MADGGAAGSSATWGSDGKLTDVSPTKPLKLTPSLNGNTKAGVVPFVYVLLVPTGQQQVKKPKQFHCFTTWFLLVDRNLIILPRPARDGHRENSSKRDAFSYRTSLS